MYFYEFAILLFLIVFSFLFDTRCVVKTGTNIIGIVCVCVKYRINEYICIHYKDSLNENIDID